MIDDAGTLISLATLLVAGGAAWGGARIAQSDTRHRLEEFGDGLADHIRADESFAREVITRLARIETKLERQE